MSAGAGPMHDEEFNRLLNGPLSHPYPMFQITRLSMALRAVIDATGVQGAEALRKYCEAKQHQDERE